MTGHLWRRAVAPGRDIPLSNSPSPAPDTFHNNRVIVQAECLAWASVSPNKASLILSATGKTCLIIDILSCIFSQFADVTLSESDDREKELDTSHRRSDFSLMMEEVGKSGLCFAAIQFRYQTGKTMTKRSIQQTIGSMRIPLWVWEIVVLGIVAAMWVGTTAYADDRIVLDSHTIGMIGKPVRSLEGKKLGRIKDLVVHWRNERYAQYAVLSVGGFWGLGEEHVAVPWTTLSQSREKDHFVLNMKEEQLKDILASTVYRFYDRSSAAVFRGNRSTTSHAMKGHSNSHTNISIAMSSGIQSTRETNVP